MVSHSSEEILQTLDTPQLEFRGGKRALDPVQAFALSKHKPYLTPGFKGNAKLHLMFPSNYPLISDITQLLHDLKAGWTLTRYPRSKYFPFKETYDCDFEISETTDYSSFSDIQRKINALARLRDRPLHILVIVSLQRSEIGGLYYKIKMASIPKYVQTQVILDNTIKRYSDPKYQKGYLLWNFSLSIFSKLGGVPWRLASKLNKVATFLSLTTIAPTSPIGIIRRKGVAALEIVNGWGEHIGRVFTDAKVEEDILERGAVSVDPSTVEALVEAALDNVEKFVGDVEKSKREDYIIFHITDRYATGVYDVVRSTVLSRGFHRLKILHIQKRGPLMLYNPQVPRKREAWPKEGSFWYLEQGRIAFLYTIGRWPYSTIPGSEPYVISSHSVSPLQVNFVTGSQGTKLEQMDLEHIYNLTRLHYYSTDLPRIKMPSTIRLGKRAALLAASGLKLQDFDVSYLY